MDIPLWAVIAQTLVIATPLVWAGLGAVVGERAGVLNLGIEGTMYAGAFTGFLVAALTGNLWLAVLAVVIVGALSGALMAFLSVTLGVNQHVAGIGITLLLIAASEFTNRLLFGGANQVTTARFERLFPGAGVFSQYGMTYVAFLVLAPLLWWMLRHTGLGLRITAVGEQPEAADVAGLPVAGTRYVALIAGGVLMALGGAFLTLSVLGRFTLDVIAGRGWICIALVIFGRWSVWPVVAGALLFGLADALQLQLAITPAFGWLPNELLIAFPYLIVVAALAIRGRGVRYPGAYLTPYRRA
ncbi:ABC transporter permease [Microbacterium sp.]|uniref:ABC transporter permease n=1 Tax=Microbacterium sp. TaxID=51671 RepID=UPI003C7796B9